jgi:DNA polymerase epsilon subunit 2
VFRKYSHSLGPDTLGFLQDILDRHEIRDEDLEFSVETLAQEYNKQDGVHSNDLSPCSSLISLALDAVMKVSLEILQRVYEALQDQGNTYEKEKEDIDPDSHLYFINAYEMPLWHWSQERSTFEKCV